MSEFVEITDGSLNRLLLEQLSESHSKDSSLTPDAASLGITTASPVESRLNFTRHGGTSEHLDIVLNVPEDCEIVAYFRLQDDTTLCQCDEYSFVNRLGVRRVIKLRFPTTGMYSLKVFARRVEILATFGGLVNVFNCVIVVAGTSWRVEPFPRSIATDVLQRGFFLIEPLNGDLPSNTQIKFALAMSPDAVESHTQIYDLSLTVAVPEALSVLVVGSNVDVRLTLRKDGLWVGKLMTGTAGNDLRLCAEMFEQSDIPTTLLIYRIVLTDKQCEDQTKARVEKQRCDELEYRCDNELKRLRDLEVQNLAELAQRLSVNQRISKGIHKKKK